MAGYKGHTAGGVAAGIFYVIGLLFFSGKLSVQTGNLLSNWQFITALIVVCVLFALWPDIDTNSKGQDIFFGVAFVADVVLIVSGHIEAAAYLGLLAMTPIIGKHRGWTHSKVSMVLVPLPLVVVAYLYKPEVVWTAVIIYGAAVCGYFSHLLLDGKIVRKIRVKSSYE